MFSCFAGELVLVDDRIPTVLRNQPVARLKNWWIIPAMHYVDRTTGELVFEFARETARRVTLLAGLGGESLIRQPMEKLANVWRTRVKLPSGWCLYAFEVDGRIQPDRAVGQLRTDAGLRCSLAVVPARIGAFLRRGTA